MNRKEKIKNVFESAETFVNFHPLDVCAGITPPIPPSYPHLHSSPTKLAALCFVIFFSRAREQVFDMTRHGAVTLWRSDVNVIIVRTMECGQFVSGLITQIFHHTNIPSSKLMWLDVYEIINGSDVTVRATTQLHTRNMGQHEAPSFLLFKGVRKQNDVAVSSFYL